MQRLLIEKIENRILVGIVMFVGIMLMVGWVAINENGRMASFDRQYLARSIERGAELYAANCTSCHGTDGRGITGRAPALNSPHFFGFDFTADTRRQMDLLGLELDQLEAEQLELAAELPNATSERTEAIQARLGEINTRLGTGEGSIDAEREELQSGLDSIYAQFVPLEIKGYPSREVLLENPQYASRLGQARWESTLESYVFTTLVHGRAQNRYLWGENVMVAWSNRAGGPLRDDQLQDVVNYILNWDKGENWTIEDLLAVQQFPKVPGLGDAGGGAATADPAGDDVEAVLTAWEEEGITGDPERGQQVYNSLAPTELGQVVACSGCHMNGANGPATEATWDNFFNERATLAQFEGYTAEQYIVESILHPNDYVVPPYTAGIMPQNFPQTLSVQDLADIIAYLKTYGTVNVDE